MKCGALVYATDQGLGVLAKSFYDHGIVTDAFIINHAHWPTHADWYPNAKRADARHLNRHSSAIKAFCREMDVMLFFEMPFDWSLIPYCRENKVKTILMPMYECEPRHMPHLPDLMLCPSQLDLQWAESLPGCTAQYLPVPVDVPWRLRTRAEVYVHNAGHGGLKGRNGTGTVIDAMRYVKSPIKLILRSQGPLQWDVTGANIDVRVGTIPWDQLYDEGDVFVFPERFNGLSLPLQEARAAGMLVIATDRFPINTWLPAGGLVKPSGTLRSCVSPRCVEYDDAIVDPRDLAARMDEWYGRDLITYSLDGRAWADSMSWEVLKPQYLKVLL